MIFSKVGVDNVSKLHKDIFLRGFYDKAKNREILSTLKVGEIKDIISSLGLSIKGKKEELIDGLISQANELSLSSALGDDYYSVSEYGKHWMYEHTLEYEWYNEPDDYPSFESYKLVRSKNSKKDIEKNRCLKEIKNDKESFGRYEYDTLIKILEEEGNKREAVICLLKELLIDVSGALNHANWKSCGFDKDMIKECSNIYFTPYLIKTLPKYHDYYEPSMIAEAYELNLPINACSFDDFKDIAEMMFDKTFDEETKNAYQNKLQNNLIRLGLNKH